jgi:hypothetical protein
MKKLWLITLFIFVASCSTAPITDSKNQTMDQLQVFMRLKAQWPNIRIINEFSVGNTVLVDNEYYVPYMAEVESLIFFHKWHEFWLQPKSKSEVFDCDDHSRKSMQDVRNAFEKGVPAYGRIGGRFPSVDPGNHLLNVMVCQDGILIYDSDFNRLWQPTEKDKVWFVEM